jgi:diadenosine tetraphosphatase ApaH/serine/threonine PP2A family protein phosphatase
VRYLIVSDIHGNWEALEAVLQGAAGLYEQTICCGDLVGYGPDPNRVVDWVRSNVARQVRGNHDKAAVGLENLDWFNPVAKAAAEWTANELTAENREYVKQIPKGPLEVESFQIAHGSPLDEDEYLFGTAEVGQAFAYLDREVTFFGHTHVQGGFTLSGRGHIGVLAGPRRDEASSVLDLDPDDLYLINPGAVGQPRDTDPRAAYVVYDSVERLVEYRRREYDIASVQDKIRRAGLPDLLANRLAIGH